MYEYTDAAIELMNLQFLKEFDRFAAILPADELNILNSAKKLYKKIARAAKLCYNAIEENYYAYFGGKAGFFEDDAVTELLECYEPVAKYVFLHETERKRARLAESLISSPETARQELKRARRLWCLQADHFAVALTDLVQKRAYKSRGIAFVRWVSGADARVCDICKKRHGKIYPLDAVPPKPHYNCRCTLRPATEEQYERQKRKPSADG